MANTSITLKKLAAAAALSVCSLAQAGVLTFEEEVDSPFIFAGDHIQFGSFWTESYGGPFTSDLVGAIVDGSDPGNCSPDLLCPVNNSSHYYAGLADGYFYFGYNDNNYFKVRSLRASFIGTAQSTNGLLILQGFNASGQTIGSAVQVGLPGPSAQGQYNFATYNLGAFSNTDYSYVRVLGYNCVGNACNRTSTLANFAIDDIETIPEPTSWALIGLGLLGLSVFTRRRAA